jgi:hypothetical protein
MIGNLTLDLRKYYPHVGWRNRDDPRRGVTGVAGGPAPGGLSRTHSAVTGGATAESPNQATRSRRGDYRVAPQACLTHSAAVECPLPQHARDTPDVLITPRTIRLDTRPGTRYAPQSLTGVPGPAGGSWSS